MITMTVTAMVALAYAAGVWTAHRVSAELRERELDRAIAVRARKGLL